MQYIHKGKTHSDTSNEYMTALGMSDEQIESVQNQLAFEMTQNKEKAKVTRDAAINADIEVGDNTWQIDASARDNINETISKCTRNDLPDTESRSWIMADNSVSTVTLADLKAVMDAYAGRMDAIYQSYATWRAGDKLEPFEFE